MTALDLTVVEFRSKPARAKSPFSTIIGVGWLVFIALGGQLVWSGITEGYCFVWPGIGTQFTSEFSHWGFARIKPGMTPEQVVALIGSPGGVSQSRGSPSGWPAYKFGDVTWSYSGDSSKLGGDWAWLAREVVLREGRVVQTVRWACHD